jgi:hypothetical protein
METPAAPAPPRELALAGGQTLVVQEAPGACTLRLVGADGRLHLAIEVTPEGPVLHLGGSVRLCVEGDLALAARRLALHADEGLELSSGGDVRVHAHDRVTLKGELIKFNC